MEIKGKMDILVGNTGFVGFNIARHHEFRYSFHSSDIVDSYGLSPELLVYAGIPSSMAIANSEPEKDFQVIVKAIENIRKINAKKTVLISSVAVYDSTICVNEDTLIDEKLLSTYGKNRRYLERILLQEFPNSLVVRLPALYGENLKKNFIYDMLHPIPDFLRKEKYMSFARDCSIIQQCYKKYNKDFYKKNKERNKDKDLLLYFEKKGFTSLNFTDSRSIYQFYNLKNLWRHITIALENGLHLFNVCTEPISAGELFFHITGKVFKNEVMDVPFRYDIWTKYENIFGNHYLYPKDYVLNDIKQFYEDSLARKV